jgi:hypothetical protein
MGDTLKVFIAGVVGIGLVTAIGLHGASLGTFATKAGSAGSGLLGTAVKG